MELAQTALEKMGKMPILSQINLPNNNKKRDSSPPPPPLPLRPPLEGKDSSLPPPYTVPAPTSQQTWAQPPQQQPQHEAFQVPQTIELKPQGHAMAALAPWGPLLTITFDPGVLGSTASPHLIFLRGDAAGPQVGSAKFHRWSSTRTELELNGQALKVGSRFESTTGLGSRLKWERDGFRKGMVLRDKRDKKAKKKKKEDENGEKHHYGTAPLSDSDLTIATFRAVGSGSSKSTGTGQFELHKSYLTEPQLEEIIISCLLERERMRRNGDMLEKGVWEVFTQTLGIPGLRIVAGGFK